MPDIVEKILGEVSATFDYYANTGELLRCAGKGYDSISIQSGSQDQSRAVKILKRYGIKVGGVANVGAGRFCITVPKKDKDRALKILNKEL